MSTVTTPKSNRRTRTAVLASVLAAVTLTTVGAAGYWWYDRNQESQASAADCRLAQRIATEAQEVAAGPAKDAEKWGRETADERRSTMKDGYLGFNIAQYEAWAVLTAQESPDAPTPKEVKALQQKAQSHCDDSGVTLSMPPFTG